MYLFIYCQMAINGNFNPTQYIVLSMFFFSSLAINLSICQAQGLHAPSPTQRSPLVTLEVMDSAA